MTRPGEPDVLRHQRCPGAHSHSAPPSRACTHAARRCLRCQPWGHVSCQRLAHTPELTPITSTTHHTLPLCDSAPMPSRPSHRGEPLSVLPRPPHAPQKATSKLSTTKRSASSLRHNTAAPFAPHAVPAAFACTCARACPCASSSPSSHPYITSAISALPPVANPLSHPTRALMLCLPLRHACLCAMPAMPPSSRPPPTPNFADTRTLSRCSSPS